MGQLFEELKRRNVFRVAVAYVVGAWLVLQVADFVLENIGAPEWVMQVFMLVFALGMPLVLVFSWAYELTPEGLKREKEVSRDQSITHHTGRKLDIATIVMLVAVLVVVGVERTFLNGATVAGSAAATSAAPENSIAVLAFDDLSPEGDQAYFADGLSEELLNVLAKLDHLQVAGRTSSFAFKGQSRDLREIGEILNVAHILEGSVRKAGNRIRVTAQLIKASTGFHVFSETYDRDLEDIFALQDEIAQSISNALLTEIVGTESVDPATQTDPEAYELYLLAWQRIYTRELIDMREASAMLDRALEIDPDYPPALAQKALAIYLLSDALGAYGATPYQEIMPEALALIDRALALDDQLAEAYAVRGLLLSQYRRHDEAIESLQRALELNPALSDAGNWLSNALNATGRSDEATKIYEDIVQRDPMYGPAFGNLTMQYMGSSDDDKADALISRVERIVGANDEVLQARGIVAVMNGHPAAAAQNLGNVYNDNPNATIVQMWYGFSLIDLADWEAAIESAPLEHKMIAYAALGFENEARRVLEDIDIVGGFPQRVLGDVADFFIYSGASGELIDYVIANFGSLDSLLKNHPVDAAWGTGYLDGLAYAYLQRGDLQTYERLVAEMRRVLHFQKQRGIDNWVTDIGSARLAAVTGDTEGGFEHLQRAVDHGYRSLWQLQSPIFDSLRDDRRFAEIERSLASILDAQRAIVGLPPYRPIDPTEEERPSSFVN